MGATLLKPSDSDWPDARVGGNYRVVFYATGGHNAGQYICAFNVEGFDTGTIQETVSELAEEHLLSGRRYIAATVFQDGSGSLFEVEPALPKKNFSIRLCGGGSL